MKQFLLSAAACLLIGAPVYAASVSKTLSVTVVASNGGGGAGEGNEEFVGPFANWINAKTGKRYDGTGATLCTAATGNGTTNDAPAIQSCINALGSSHPVLWFPAANYRINSGLTWTAAEYVSLIGADPATTTITYGGSSNPSGTMLTTNGVAYSRVDRLTFAGASLIGNGVAQAWDGSTGYFDTANEYADDQWTNFTNDAIDCGTDGHGCAETAVLRNQFPNDASAVWMRNFNALDMWIWYSNFTSNQTALGNTGGAGNFSVFNSTFGDSANYDIALGNTGIMTFYGNYSTGSNQFLNCSTTSNPNNLTLENNVILDTIQSASIKCGDFGPIIAVDNNIRSLSAATAPIVDGTNSTDVFSTGNRYTVAAPVSASRAHSIGDTVLSIADFNSAVNTAAPTLPGAPPNNNRTIYEVAPGSSTATIQTAITNAAATQGSVVHLQASNYSVTSTLTVPASTFIQIIGDGGYSQLTWAGSGSGPVLQCNGPCVAVFRDFQINGNGETANGIVVTNADQAGSRVFGEELYLNLSGADNLRVDSLDYTNIELHDFESVSSSGNGVNVIGGSSASGGNWLGGATNIFAGLGYANAALFAKSNNAHLNVRQFWNDADGGASAKTLAALTDGGAFSIAGMTGYLNNSNTATHSFALTGYTGVSALLNVATNESSLQGDETISGSGSGASNLTVGYLGISAAPFSDTTSPADTHGFLNGQSVYCVGASTCPGAGSAEVAESGISTLGFVNTALAPLRASHTTVPGALGIGVTDARFYRVYVQNSNIGLWLKH